MADKCDYCNGPVFSIKDMGSYLSVLCERHYYKNLEMEEEDG